MDNEVKRLYRSKDDRMIAAASPTEVPPNFMIKLRIFALQMIQLEGDLILVQDPRLDHEYLQSPRRDAPSCQESHAPIFLARSVRSKTSRPAVQ